MDERTYVHLARLESDYRSMLKLRGPIIWEHLTALDLQRNVYPTRYRVIYELLAHGSVIFHVG